MENAEVFSGSNNKNSYIHQPRVVKGQAFTLKHKENGQSSDESDTLGDLDKIGGPAKKGAPTKRKQLLEKEIHKSRKNKLEADDVEKMKRVRSYTTNIQLLLMFKMLTPLGVNPPIGLNFWPTRLHRGIPPILPRRLHSPAGLHSAYSRHSVACMHRFFHILG